MGGGAIFKKKYVWETKRGMTEEMQKSYGDVMWLLAMMVTNTVFRKSGLEKLF